MNKPKTLKDLLIGGHINRSEIETIARAIFTDATTMAGPEGYLVTGANFDDLPPHVQGFIVKAILEFGVKNVLDASEDRDGLYMDSDEAIPEPAPEG